MAQQITRLGDGTLFITDAQYVGIGTNDPNEILTVIGNVSASNVFVTSTISASSFSLGAGAGSSSNWDSVYTSVNSNSANWNTAYGWGNHASAGYQSALTFGIANTNALKVDDADAADNDYAKFTANGLEGRSYAEVRTDLGLGTIYNCAATDFLAAAGKAADADKLDGQDSTYYGIRNHFQSVGVFNIDCGITGSKTTTSCVMSFLDSCNIFDSYVGALKTGWNYAGNCDLCDAGRLTELAGTSWLTWTDSSSDSTRGNITALVIAPNTGGSANKAFIYNDQGSGYAPGWREIWTNASDGSGSGLDADCLDGQEGTHYLDYNNFTNTPTIPTNYITNDADDTMSGTLTVTGNVSAAGLWDNGKRVCTAAYPTVGSGCITITAGTDLSTGGDFNVNQTGATTITIDHSDITRTDTTSTASPANGGTIDVIDSITSNDRGHITAANVKTITLPSNAANADTVDNLHGTQFLRQDVSTTKVGNLDFTSNNACLSLSNYGRVGIGMTDPQHPLEICLGDNSTFTSGLVFVKNSGNRGSRGHSNGSALFQYCFSDHPGMILNKDGNVGIGTDAPNTRLTVSGSISADTEIYEAGKRVCTAAYPTVTNPNNATITLSAGNGLTTGGDFTTNQNTNETIVFHVGVGTGIVATEDGIAIDDNCNTVWSQNTTYNTATSDTLGLVKIGYTESGQNYPVELSNGQMFVNVPWSNTNTNTTYSVTTVDVAGSAAAKLRLSGSDSTTDDITFAVSQNLTIEATPASDLITITGPDLSSYAQTANLGTAAFENCGTFALAGHNHSGVYDNYGDWDLYTDGAHRANITSGKNVNFIGGTNVSVTYGTGSGNCDVTISATDNNTTYSASTGLTLTGTAFSINSTCRTAIANGATAHGWGNHALAGYCTTDTNTTYSAGNGLTLTSTTFAMDFTNATTTDAFLFYDGTKLKSTNCHITRSNDDVLIGKNATTTGGLGVWGFINVVGKKKIVVNNCDYVINAEGCVRAQVFDAYSDGKYKTDVNNITNAVSTVKNLRGVCFKWNDCFYTRDGGMLPETRNCNYGLIAQEVEEYLPDIVTSAPHIDLKRGINNPDPNAETFKSMSYDSLIPFLIEAIKEQQTKIEELEDRLATLELQSNT